MHHVDKVSRTRLLRYHPQYNLYHASQVVEGRVLADSRSATLSIKHTIRNNNISLYQERLTSMPV